MIPAVGPRGSLATMGAAGHIPHWVRFTLLYTGVALVYLVLPLGGGFADRLLGTALFEPDPVLNAGILEWGYRALWTSTLSVFDWTAGFPFGNMLAGTENLLGWQVLYSPLRRFGVGNVAAYNTLLVVSIIVSGSGAAALSRRFGASVGGASVAGFLFAFAPFHLNHLVHIQTMAVCWSPFAILYLDRLLESGAVKDAAGLTSMVVLTGLSGAYFGVFLALILPLYVLASVVVGRHRLRPRPLSMMAAAAVLSAALLVPVALPYLRFAVRHGLSHSPEELMTFSVALVDLLKVPSWLAMWSHTPLAEGSRWTAAFPGIVALALVGALPLVSRGDDGTRRVVLMLSLLALAALLLSMGPVLKIRGDYPSRLAPWIPMPGRIFTLFSAVRAPSMPV